MITTISLFTFGFAPCGAAVVEADAHRTGLHVATVDDEP